jgi:hypothetical protein
MRTKEGREGGYVRHRPRIIAKVHLHHFSKIISQKKSQKTVVINVFLLFLLDNRRIRIRSRIMIHISDLWIRMRIREAQKTYGSYGSGSGCGSATLKRKTTAKLNEEQTSIAAKVCPLPKTIFKDKHEVISHLSLGEYPVDALPDLAAVEPEAGVLQQVCRAQQHRSCTQLRAVIQRRGSILSWCVILSVYGADTIAIDLSLSALISCFMKSIIVFSNYSNLNAIISTILIINLH